MILTKCWDESVAKKATSQAGRAAIDSTADRENVPRDAKQTRNRIFSHSERKDPDRVQQHIDNKYGQECL